MDVVAFLRSKGRKWAYTRYIKVKYSYTSNGLMEYIGYAPGTAAATDAQWWIWRLTYDGNNRLTDSQMADVGDNDGVIWNNRVTESYL